MDYPVRLLRLEARVSDVEDGYLALCAENGVCGFGGTLDATMMDLIAELRTWAAAMRPVVLEVNLSGRLLLQCPEEEPRGGDPAPEESAT